MFAGVRREVQLREDAANVGLDRLGAEAQLCGQRAVRKSLRHEGEHPPLSLRQGCEWITPAFLGDEPGDEFESITQSLGGDAVHIAGEGGQLRDPVLEEVAHPALESVINRTA